MKVRDIMTRSVVTTTPDAPFPELVDQLLGHGVSGLPVVDADGHLAGIVTEADLVSKEAYAGQRRRAMEVLADLLAGRQARWAVKGRGRTAADVMTKQVHTAQPSEDLRVAARRMFQADVKRLPVVDEGRVVGIISRTDLLRVLHRSDEDIEGDLAKLLGEPLHASEDHEAVAVSVGDGIVTLTGTLRYARDVPILTATAWQVPGVVDVRNEVTARDSDPRLPT